MKKKYRGKEFEVIVAPVVLKWIRYVEMYISASAVVRQKKKAVTKSRAKPPVEKAEAIATFNEPSSRAKSWWLLLRDFLLPGGRM